MVHVGTKGKDTKIQSIRFPKWMWIAIDDLAKKGGHTFTDVVIELCRQALERMGKTMGIGWDTEDTDKKNQKLA